MGVWSGLLENSLHVEDPRAGMKMLLSLWGKETVGWKEQV